MLDVHPLSVGGYRVWLRGLLQWEPPEDFVGWLHQQTLGLPRYFQKALTYLVERRVLEKEGGQWRLQAGALDHSLRAKLSIRPSRGW